MKLYIHNYQGYGVHPSKCRVHIKNVGITTWIGFENLGYGTSVTNASEQIASGIVQRELLDPASCKFFEWYPEYEGTVDEVSYRWNGPEASNPEWKHFCEASENPFLNK